MSVRYSLVVPILLVVACARESHVSEPLPWTVETLQPGMTISVPPGYEGEGYRCGIDTCSFHKRRTDGAITLGFTWGAMTGYTPARVAELPASFGRNPHRVLIETESGLAGALYYILESEYVGIQSNGQFIVEEQDGSGYWEVISVTFDSEELSRVQDILKTIHYQE